MSKNQNFEIFVAIVDFLCYNMSMNRLFYATFERGIQEAVKKFISKHDKNSFIKKLTNDSVLFFGDENFKRNAGIFKAFYIVLDSTKKTGAGAVNAEMKHILERKDLKIFFPREISSFKFVVSSEYENSNVDSKLKQATEIALKRITKKSISFNASQAELSILAKKDGDVLFLKKVFLPSELTKFEKFNDLPYDLAFLMNFLAEPCAGETVVEAFAESGKISYVRALCFKKATVIANSADADNIASLKKVSKHLSENHFSVMNYDFLSEKFPIRYIDKIVTQIPDYVTFADYSTSELSRKFIEKSAMLKVKTIVVLTSKGNSISRYLNNLYDIQDCFETQKYEITKLSLKK